MILKCGNERRFSFLTDIRNMTYIFMCATKKWKNSKTSELILNIVFTIWHGVLLYCVLSSNIILSSEYILNLYVFLRQIALFYMSLLYQPYMILYFWILFIHIFFQKIKYFVIIFINIICNFGVSYLFSNTIIKYYHYCVTDKILKYFEDIEF